MKNRFLIILIIIEGLITSFFYLNSPSEKSSQVFLGFSLPKLVLIGFSISLTIFFIFLFSNNIIARSLVNYFSIQRQREGGYKRLSFIAVFMLSNILFFVPDYRFGVLAPVIYQLKPVLLWLCLIFLKIFIILVKKTKPDLRIIWNEIHNSSRHLAFYLFLLVIWAFVSITKIGIAPGEPYWNMVGVPLLNEQIILSVIFSIAFLLILRVISRKTGKLHEKKVDFVIFLLLWGCAALLWVVEPLPKSFFAVGPYPPNFEYYPYADPSYFDIGAQFALIGEGLFAGKFYDRALLSGFLTFVHLIFGQSYKGVVNFQSFLFASIVPVLYLIGKKLHSPTSGFLLAFLGIFKVINSIAASTLVQTSHPKFLLTEFPTAVLVALFTLYLIKWCENGEKELVYLIVLSGLVGLGIMLRTNMFSIFVLPFVLIYFKKTPAKKKFRYSIVLILAFFVTISPWMWRNYSVANKPFFFLGRFKTVIKSRYSTYSSSAPDRSLVRHFARGEQAVDYIDAPFEYVNEQYDFVLKHFFHNIVTTIIALPTSPYLNNLNYSLREAFPYWNKHGYFWDGRLLGVEAIFVGINLFLIATGISLAYKIKKVTGLAPFYMFLLYHFSNGLARTSGGRYIVPVDWIILLYYAIGLAQVILYLSTKLGLLDTQSDIFASESKSPKIQISPPSIIKAILPFFSLVFLITVFDQAIPQAYTAKTTEELVIEFGSYSNSHISETEILSFLVEEDARIIEGRVLYPRFYKEGQGEIWIQDAHAKKDFSRLSFTMIGTFGRTGVVLDSDKQIDFFPNASDVIVIGCQHPKKRLDMSYIDALLILLSTEDEVILLKSDHSRPLNCQDLDP